MKRSHSVRLALLGTASLLSLYGCDQADDPLKSGQFFSDAQACESAHNKQECNEALARANEEHVRSAPKFASREACEAEFGAQNCVQPATAQAGGGSWFMPAMMGFMMGRMMGGAMAAQPVYRDTHNNAYTGRQPIGRIDNARMPPPQRIAGTAGAPSYSPARGGFGRTGGSTAS